MKKVLILEGSASPNGNSCILSDEFARGAEEAGCSVEKVMVARKKISGCLGCNACYRNGGTCVQKDDMEEIRAKMLEGKTFYFIVTCGAPDTAFTETMLASLRGFTCCVPAFSLARKGSTLSAAAAFLKFIKNQLPQGSG